MAKQFFSGARLPQAARMFVVACVSLLTITACSLGAGASELYVPALLQQPQQYNGKDISVDGAYIGKGGAPSTSVLALGVSTADNGLDAQPMGDQIWLDGFPEQQIKEDLHQPGDAVYGFVRIAGRFESGGTYGPEGKYKYRIQVASATPIEQVTREEERITNASLGEGKTTLFELADNGAAYNGQKVTSQGYYFWNGAIYVLAEGISREQDGSSPQPVGKQIWMEGFPPDKSSQLHVGPNNSFVWGKVEVTGAFQGGGNYGKDGAYKGQLQVESATVLEQK